MAYASMFGPSSAGASMWGPANPSGPINNFQSYDPYGNPYPSIMPQQSTQQPTNALADAWQMDPKLAEAANYSINEGRNTLSQLPGTAQIFQQGAAAADPFSGERGQYQNQLKNIMSGDFTANDPSYKFRFDQGQQALERSAAAKGQIGSGNVLQALQKYGQDMASQEFQNQYNRLVPLTGATTGSPGAAGNILAGQYGAQRNAQADIGQGLAAQANPVVAAQQTTQVTQAAKDPYDPSMYKQPGGWDWESMVEARNAGHTAPQKKRI